MQERPLNINTKRNSSGEQNIPSLKKTLHTLGHFGDFIYLVNSNFKNIYHSFDL